MKTLSAWLTLLVLWALIYLPGLGDLEIRGEEWRRTLPGKTMIQTGEWLVPFSGGEPYLRKPPLINWTSAASFSAFGEINEWTARMPSVLLVLAGALLIYALLQSFLSKQGALVVSVLALSCVGMLEKGRIAELEIYYMVFTGVAVIAWLAGFMRAIPRVLSWTLVGVSLGLGMLTKGPVHLAFFYSIAICVILCTRRWRSLLGFGHLWAIILMIGISAMWVLPFAAKYGELMGLSGSEIKDYWVSQITSRTSGKSGTTFADYLLRWPKGLVLFLPWVLLAPLLIKSRRELMNRLNVGAPVYRGVLYGSLISAFIILVVPSSSGRYIAPLVYPVALLLGWGAERISVRSNSPIFLWSRRVLGVVLALGLLAALAISIYQGVWPNYPWSTWVAWGLLGGIAFWCMLQLTDFGHLERFLVRTSFAVPAAIVILVFAGHPLMSQKEDIRHLGQEIAGMLQDENPLYVFDMGEIPYPFYFPTDAREIGRKKDLPKTGVKWVLTTEKKYENHLDSLERRYGKLLSKREFTATWGDRQKGKRIYLLNFPGVPADQVDTSP